MGAVIDTAKGVIKYNGIEKKLIYDNGNILNQHYLTEENTILPLKEFILKKYFDEKAQIRSESEMGNQSEFSLGYTNPEHAIVEKYDKNKSLVLKNSEHAVVELSDNQKINNIKISSVDQRKDLENEILNIINEKHSKINMQIPFRTDIRGEINTVNDKANYSKQYPYALSASDFLNSEISRMTTYSTEFASW